MEKYVIELKDLSKRAFLLELLAQLDFVNVRAEKEVEEKSEQMPGNTILQRPQPFITKGDKSIDPKSLFGIWKNNPRSLQEIRQKAWERN